MANVCAYQFVLRPHEGQSGPDCLDAVRDEIADWICEIYRAVGLEGVAIPFDGTCIAPHPTHELWSEQRECSTHRWATIEWVWPEGEDPTLSWVLACTAACDDKAVQVALLIQIVSRPFVLRPWRFVLNEKNPLSYLPGLASRLLRVWPGEIGDWPIPTQARTLRANAIDVFVRETLRHPARVLPVVVVNLSGGRVNVPEGGLQNAQDRMAGQAQLAALANKSALDRLVRLTHEEDWSHAQARIYWPRLPGDKYPIPDAALAAEMKQAMQRLSLDQFFLSKCLEFSAARYREGDLIRAARLAVDREQAAWRQVASTAEREVESAHVEARQAQEERDRLRQECDAGRQIIRSLQADLAALRDAAQGAAGRVESFDELAVELERAWDDNRRLTGDLDDNRRRLAELEADLRIHQENWTLFAASRVADGRAPAPVPASERAFATVAEALEAATGDFADVLQVWEDARRSAEASPFRTPSKVYRAVQAIAEVGRAYFQAKEGGPPLGPVEQSFACRVPFKYTGFESHTTLHLYGAERVFHHGDHSRQMQRHLTLGGGETNNCLQIYFEFDDASHRVLIGYCGRHLPYHRQRT